MNATASRNSQRLRGLIRASAIKMTFLGAMLLFPGCTTSGVIPAGPDTFMISAGGVGFSTAGVRERTYITAQKFCADRGLVFVPVSFDAQTGVMGQRAPTADLVFRALPPGDPEIKRPNLEKPDSIQRVQNR